MNKPEPKLFHKPCLDYHEARDYIEKKYGFITEITLENLKTCQR